MYVTVIYGIPVITIFCGTINYIADAILKLEEALVIDPLKDDTLFVLGQCFCALISHDPTEAKGYLRNALAWFQKASHEVNYIFNPFTFSISLSSII